MHHDIQVSCKVCGLPVTAVLDSRDGYSLVDVRQKCGCWLDRFLVEEEAQDKLVTEMEDHAWKAEYSRGGA